MHDAFPMYPRAFVFQELLSHSSDRPEKQQLKEALEAMQVQQTRGWTDSPASWGRQLSFRARVCGLLFDGIHSLLCTPNLQQDHCQQNSAH